MSITSIQRAFAFRAAFIARLVEETHWWCPRCIASEAFHPEACPITPEEWRRDADEAVAEALKLAAPMDATEAYLTRRFGLPQNYINEMADTAGCVWPCSPDRLPPELRRKLAAYWYRWIIAR